MTLRAAIFDIYATILEVMPPPADADARWASLWHDVLGTAPRIGLAEFGAGCAHVVTREHATARAAGIQWPEVFWPDVLLDVVPELAERPGAACDEFMLRQAALWHTVRLMPSAADTLRALRDRGVLLGIASNAQPYTVRELADALAGAGLTSDIFVPDLSFWSFAHGFSKPDPHVFRVLTARLRALGVAPAETVMVGDRLDNDIEPARAQGWRTWQLTNAAPPNQRDAGGWHELAGYCSDLIRT